MTNSPFPKEKWREESVPHLRAHLMTDTMPRIAAVCGRADRQQMIVLPTNPGHLYYKFFKTNPIRLNLIQNTHTDKICFIVQWNLQHLRPLTERRTANGPSPQFVWLFRWSFSCRTVCEPAICRRCCLFPTPISIYSAACLSYHLRNMLVWHSAGWVLYSHKIVGDRMLCEWSPFDMEGRIVWRYGGWGNCLANLQIDKFNDLLVLKTKFGWR